ncbi:hypothetical protein CSZ94_04470 [Janthinobacterium sp. ROICE36]|uniref:aldo/keto reductase n=1 Tax=Janthinobacterium sp. ROICE36 TaxID=2048670 RepID=UPI000C7F0792|nr:aldo/keto reductase [Janthinobacterium sp. ROICE36]PLY45319.1 hypothetical protein CSZ94_04470 [Janthinobacterium sp. ROICE36]
MRYKQLGNTRLFVSEPYLGTMTCGPAGQAGLYHDLAGMDQATADNIVQRCLDADVKANGLAERRAYVRAKPFATSVVMGAKRLVRLEQNLAAVNLELDADALARFDSVSKLRPENPGVDACTGRQTESS